MERLRVTSGFLYCSWYLLVETGVEGEISMVLIGAEVESRLPMTSTEVGRRWESHARVNMCGYPTTGAGRIGCS